MSPKQKNRVRLWTEEDIPAIVECHEAAYPDYPPEGQYDQRIYKMQFTAFPQGQLLAEVDGKIIGYATSLIVQLDDDSELYTYAEITGAGTFSTHTPSGDTLYGADIAVHPDYRGQGIAAKLYVHRKRLLKRYNLRRMVAYGRLPGYKKVAGKMTAEEYVEAVKNGELNDMALNAHLKAGYDVKRVLLHFVGDDASMNYSTVLEMPNPDFSPERRKIASAPLRRPVRKVRVCAAQYYMRTIKKWEEFAQNVEFFVDTADEYHCHFLLFPELFTAQLFSTMPPDMDSRDAMKKLATFTPKYLELFKNFSMERNLYIIAGSHPVERNNKLYNVSHLFTPTGHVYTQDKLHITPAERRYFGIHPGESINVFDTPYGRFAIQICYDIEFPEVSRLLKLRGVEAIFVPFSTDEKKAYNRVRFTAQARAVENIIYVALSGNVGNLHTIRSYLINYGQAAILSPSDFAFPLDAKLAEVEANEETVVISDLDLGSIRQQGELGSVRPLYDMRLDLYELKAKLPIKLIRTE